MTKHVMRGTNNFRHITKLKHHIHSFETNRMYANMVHVPGPSAAHPFVTNLWCYSFNIKRLESITLIPTVWIGLIYLVDGQRSKKAV